MSEQNALTGVSERIAHACQWAASDAIKIHVPMSVDLGEGVTLHYRRGGKGWTLWIDHKATTARGEFTESFLLTDAASEIKIRALVEIPGLFRRVHARAAELNEIAARACETFDAWCNEGRT